MAILVGVRTHHSHTDFQTDVSDWHFLDARPRPRRVVAGEHAVDEHATGGGLNEEIAVAREEFIVLERPPNGPRHGRTAVGPIDVVGTPWKVGAERDLSTPGGIHLQRRTRFVDVPFDHNAAGVLFETTPQNTGARSFTIVLHPQAEGEGITRLHGEVDLKPLAFEKLRIVV